MASVPLYLYRTHISCYACDKDGPPTTGGNFVYNACVGDVICCRCGRVVEVNRVDYANPSLRSSPRYRRRNHFNQILLAWARNSHCLAPDLYEVFRETVRTKYAIEEIGAGLSKSQIHHCLRSCQLNWVLQRKYRSDKRLLKRLIDRKQFSLRWWDLKDSLAKEVNVLYSPSIPGQDLIQMLSRLFIQLCETFEAVRHTPSCDGEPRCHTRCGCRYGIYYSYQIVRRLIWVIGGDDLSDNWTYKLPKFSKQKTSEIDKRLDTMFELLNWPIDARLYLLKHFRYSPIVIKYIL